MGWGFKRQVIQPGLGIHVPLLRRPFLHSALGINSVSWISGERCLRSQRQCLTGTLKNTSETQILMLAISNSHLLNKANPLQVSAATYSALKNNLRRSDLRVGPGACSSSAPGSLVEMHILRPLRRPLQPESQGGGHSQLLQQAPQVSLV